MRKHNVDEINLRITSVEFFDGGVQIFWSSTIGYGVYTIAKEKDFGDIMSGVVSTEDSEDLGVCIKPSEYYIDSETMDSKDDKEFGKKLFSLFLEEINKVC